MDETLKDYINGLHKGDKRLFFCVYMCVCVWIVLLAADCCRMYEFGERESESEERE